MTEPTKERYCPSSTCPCISCVQKRQPTTAEIRERHDILQSCRNNGGVPYLTDEGNEAHDDRGILLKRLEAAEQRIKEQDETIKRLLPHVPHETSCNNLYAEDGAVINPCDCKRQGLIKGDSND